MNSESIALYYTNGSSDKVYQVQLNPVKDGWEITAQNGRRGSSLTHRVKTKEPLPYEKAKKAYDKIVKVKMNGGYTPDSSGEAFVNTENAGKTTGYLPQLLNEITEDEILAMHRKGIELWMQTKWDGERRGALCTDDNAIGANRRGLAVPLKETIRGALIALTRQCGGKLDLDTEDMGDHFMIFDALQFGSVNLKTLPLTKRIRPLVDVSHKLHKHQLTRFLKVDLPIKANSVQHIKEFVAKARKNNEEGVVFRMNVPVTPGRPNSGGPCLKLKFWESATCMVFSNHDTKRSIGLAVYDDDELIFIGNCTVPEKYNIPELEDLVEIKYLYAYRGGSLFEPSYKGKRPDLEHSAADINQLKYKK